MNKRIIHKRKDGKISIMTPVGSIEDCVQIIPKDIDYFIIDVSELPSEYVFRDQFKINESNDGLEIDIVKAKEFTHEMRRKAREKEFKPYDEIIMKQIPGNNLNEAETARAEIRAKYESIQNDIESKETAEELNTIFMSLIKIYD